MAVSAMSHGPATGIAAGSVPQRRSVGDNGNVQRSCDGMSDGCRLRGVAVTSSSSAYPRVLRKVRGTRGRTDVIVRQLGSERHSRLAGPVFTEVAPYTAYRRLRRSRGDAASVRHLPLPPHLASGLDRSPGPARVLAPLSGGGALDLPQLALQRSASEPVTAALAAGRRREQRRPRESGAYLSQLPAFGRAGAPAALPCAVMQLSEKLAAPGRRWHMV